jgi:protein disulfide-isomerase
VKLTRATFVTALILLAAFFATSSAAAKPGWTSDLKQAQEEAKRSNKLVLLDFTGSDWCGYCIALDREVFAQPVFKKYAREHLVLVEIDFPRRKRLPLTQQRQNEQLAQQHGIMGFPTIVVLDPDGKRRGHLGYMPGGPQAFIAALEQIRTGKGS